MTSLNTGVVMPVVGPGRPSFQAVESLSSCGYAMAGLSVWLGWRSRASLTTASLSSSLCSVTACLLLPPSLSSMAMSGPMAMVPSSSFPK